MPQMFPMNWLLMFLTFIGIFLISINKIFYSPVTRSSSYDSKHINVYQNIWKW